MMIINIDRKALKAVSRFQAVGDVRYYLNGVCVQSTALQTQLVATDGRMMAMHRGDWKDENKGACESLIIPADAVKTMLAWKIAKSVNFPIVLTLPDGYDVRSEIRAECAGNVCVFKAIDGKFPDYSRVIPNELSGESAQFDPRLLATVQSAAEDFRKEKAYTHFAMNGNGTGLATVSTSDRFMAVIMPMRGDAPTIADIAWAKSPLAVEVAAEPEQVAA